MNEAINWLYEEDNFTLMCKCTACGEPNDGHTKYCPNCGADMRSGT